MDKKLVNKYRKLSNEDIKKEIKTREDKIDFWFYNSKSWEEYLKETKLNNNYAELAIKYSDFANKEEINIVLEYEDVIKLLKEQFQNISAKTQNALILYFSKYKDLFEIILDIDDYDTRDVKDVIVSLNSNKLYKDLKKKLYDNVKESLSLDINKDFVVEIPKEVIKSFKDFNPAISFCASLKFNFPSLNPLISPKLAFNFNASLNLIK